VGKVSSRQAVFEGLKSPYSIIFPLRIHRPTGSFDASGELVAIAGYKEWRGGEGAIAHIAIVTAGDCRHRGHGTAAVALAAEHALNQGLLPQYRTLKSNAPSMHLAENLGFEEYGFSVYVRLGAQRG